MQKPTACFELNTGGLSDNLRQLQRFASLCYFHGIEPGLAPLNSYRYLRMGSDMQHLHSELFGNSAAPRSFDVEFTCVDFLERIDQVAALHPGNKLLVHGDHSIRKEARQQVSQLRESSPEDFEQSSRLAGDWLAGLLRQGNIYRRYRQRRADTRSAMTDKKSVLVHIRLGDLVLLKRSDHAGTPLQESFKAEYFCPITGFVDAAQLQAKMLEMPMLPTRLSYTAILKRYKQALENLVATAPRESWHITLNTDGFTRGAQVFCSANPALDPAAVEQSLNRIHLQELINGCDEAQVGEQPEQLVPVLDFTLDAEYCVLGVSDFPICLRAAMDIPGPVLIKVDTYMSLPPVE